MTQHSRKVLIATPTHSGEVTLEYMMSVRSLEASLRAAGIDSDVRMNIGSNIARQRNALASVVLNDDSYTHLLFIDSDMSFDPALIQRMLDLGEEFCGCLYPSKAMNYAEFSKVAKLVDDPVSSNNISLNYVMTNYLESRLIEGKVQYRIRDGFIRTLEVGCGIVLVARTALLKLKERYPDLIVNSKVSRYYASMGEDFEILQCFETVVDERSAYLSEDLSFCWRWTKGCGGEIWACADHTVGHIGRHKFEGRALDKLLYRGSVVSF